MSHCLMYSCLIRNTWIVNTIKQGVIYDIVFVFSTATLDLYNIHFTHRNILLSRSQAKTFDVTATIVC